MSEALAEVVQAYLHPFEKVRVAIDAENVKRKNERDLKRVVAVVANETGRYSEAAYVTLFSTAWRTFGST